MSERLRDAHRHIELHDERLIELFAKDAIEEVEAGDSLGGDDVLLAHAGVDHQAERERKIGVAGKVFDGLRPAVFEDLEIFAIEVADDVVLFVENSGEDAHDFYVSGEVGASSCAFKRRPRQRPATGGASTRLLPGGAGDGGVVVIVFDADGYRCSPGESAGRRSS